MNELHHANIVVSKEDVRDFVYETLEKNLGFKVQANPDFLLIENASFGIDDARGFEKWAIGKPLLGEFKASLIIAESITFEAQNALLKVLEEPPIGTYIFISLPSLGGILPTFLSRVRVMRSDKESAGPEKNDALKFLKSDIKGRLSLIRSLSKKEDRAELLGLLKDLEAAAYQTHKNGGKEEASKAETMKNILVAKVFAASRGSSPKMLLEWLSCMV